MYLNQLDTFLCVAKCKSFSKAAKILFLSQPTISSHIKSLESELNVQLFIRSTKEVELSEAGEIFYPCALKMLATRDIAFSQLQKFNTKSKQTLKIAASSVPSQYLLPPALTKVKELYPEAVFRIEQVDSEQVIENVSNFESFIGIGGMNTGNPKCTFKPFFEDNLVVITPNNSFYQSLHKHFPPRLLLKEPFINRESGSGTQQTIEAFFEQHNISNSSLNITATMETTEEIKKAVAAGLGISIISGIAAEDYLKFGYLLSFEFPLHSPKREMYMITHKEYVLSPLADALYKTMVRMYHL